MGRARAPQWQLVQYCQTGFWRFFWQYSQLDPTSYFILHTSYAYCRISLMCSFYWQVHVNAACWCTFTTANLVAGSVQCTVHWCVGSWCEPYLVPKSISPCWPPSSSSSSSSSILPPSEHCTVHSAHLPERGFHCTCPCKMEFTALNTCSPQMVALNPTNHL